MIPVVTSYAMLTQRHGVCACVLRVQPITDLPERTRRLHQNARARPGTVRRAAERSSSRHVATRRDGAIFLLLLFLLFLLLSCRRCLLFPGETGERERERAREREREDRCGNTFLFLFFLLLLFRMVDLANMETVEKECGALGGLFQAIVNDMKCSYPVWEDFSAKATKLHSQLRTTVLAAVAFLDAFQKVADMATNTRGATRDIGSALTRMCMRHRSIEAKLRQFTNALMESLIAPLQDKIEDWKKTANQLDKDHAKEYKRSRHEIKKKSSDTMKLQKKARKGRGDLQPQLDSAMQDVTDMCLLMEETEKQAVRRALVEERGRFCTFIGFLQPVVNGEIAMLGEITHLQAIIDDLTVLTSDPHKLPAASEQVIKDLKGSDYSWSYQTPPSSPSSSSSRKSSMCSSVNSAHSSASRSSGGGGGGGGGGGSLPHSPTSSSSSYRYRSSLPCQPPPAGGIAAHRLSSVSSHDSGFVSQDANIYSKPPSPMPSDLTSQKSSSSASSEASETCQSVSECSSPTADWSKAASYEQPAAATAPATVVQRRKEAPLNEGSPSAQGYAGPSHADDGQRPRMSSAAITAKYGDEASPAASDLAMVLTRGLSTEQQKSSRDSLQYSSGYSTETTTPSCSEDTIPSQGSDYDCYSVNGDAEGPDGQSDFDKSSTIPRHSNIAQNYRRMIQTKRPASTAGLPSGVLSSGGHMIAGQPAAGGGGSGTPGTATIRRTPSTKPGVRRTLSSAGPIPIRPPIVPVKTPTIPGDSHSPGAGAYVGGVPVRVGSEECVFFTGADDAQGVLDYVKASPKRLSLPNTAWGSGAALEVYAQQHGVSLGGGSEEEKMIAANRHSLVEKIGELVASAHALGEGQFPFPALPDDPAPASAGFDDAATGAEGAEDSSGDMLTTIRRGVRLRKTVSNDRSAPRIL
uniref:protein MTSS 2-like isoform X3 n=1 Tax=Doryrhamphus excisus TaxID=161450 RepID=UPI0025AEB66D|nr:protein MTSS 2-like isoform X3 [Doryrhamphus excisus]